MRTAELEAAAAALEASSAALRAAGVEERAAELFAEAAALRKRATPLPPGRRLDEAEGYLKRCETRAAKAEQAQTEAEKTLDKAKADKQEADKELKEAQEQLKQLRYDLKPDEATGFKRQRREEASEAADAKAELETLRAKLLKTEQERDEAKAAATEVKGGAAAEDDKGVDELEHELAEETQKHEVELKAGRLPPAPALQRLSGLAVRLEARRRAGPYS